MKKSLTPICVLCFLATQFFAIAQPVQWTTGSGANNHFYEAVSAPNGISWEGAEAIAESRGGYLATLTSPQENAFVFSLINNPIYWINDQAGNSQGPWIGGIQLPGSVEPAGGWQWINGEGPLPSNNWTSGEPNNANGGEDRLQFFGIGLNDIQSTWNDEREAPYAAVHGFVIETVPEPSCVALVGMASLWIIRKRRQSIPTSILVVD